MKEKLKAKFIKEKKLVNLSAQDYARLSNEEKAELKEIAGELGQDDYEQNIKKLFPKEFTPKEIKWRHK
jgi:hypothetical protein